MDSDPVGFGGCGAVRSLGFRESRKVKEFRMEPDIAGLELGVVENVVDHLAHPVRFLDDEVEIFISGVLVFPVDVADELRISGDHGERGAEFMGDIRDDFFPEDIDSRECLAEKSDRFREFAELIMTFYIGAGGKVVRGELIDRVLDREDRLCEMNLRFSFRGLRIWYK